MYRVRIIAMGDIDRLDARLLIAFDALMAERSVTRAARRIGMTQQGLSGLLARLRDLFADPLFVRDAGGVAPTPRAEALHPRVRAALRALEQVVERSAFDPATVRGTLNIAASDYAAATVIAPAFKPFRDAAPWVRLAVQPLDPTSLGEAMRSGRIDLALTIPDVAPPNLPVQQLFSERYVCVVGAGHPLARNAPVDVDLLCAYEHLLVAPHRGDFSGPADRALARVGRRRRIGLVVPNFSVVGAILGRTDLVAVLPERLVPELGSGIHAFAPPVPIEGFDLIAVWPPRVDADPLHLWFRDLCAAAVAADHAGSAR